MDYMMLEPYTNEFKGFVSDEKVMDEFGLTVAFSDLVSWKWNKLERLIAITEYLGFTIERVYEAYCSKNKINYQRLKEGY